jgi:hypothetical protein
VGGFPVPSIAHSGDSRSKFTHVDAKKDFVFYSGKPLKRKPFFDFYFLKILFNIMWFVSEKSQQTRYAE